MNILVTGANGQLGMELRKRSAGKKDRFIFTDVSEVPGVETIHLDITNKDAIRIIAVSERIDAIINCAAYTNVEKAEDDTVLADLLNRQAPGNLATVAREINAALIHISTDFIFSGRTFTPIREDAAPDPVNAYGATKLAGERAVRNSGCRHIILRTAWLYSPYGKNFVKTMLNLTESKKSISVVADQIGTPTYAGDLADAILTILGNWDNSKTGTYHFTDEGTASWYDFAKAVNDMAGHGCDVRPCMSGEYPSKAERPHYSVLDKSLIKKTFGIVIPHWTESLKECLMLLVK